MKKIILCTILIFALIISSFTVFSADPDPYAGRQIIILRLDDLRSRTTGAFEWALNAATERNVKVSFGVIGDALDDGVCNRRFIDFVKYADSLGMEIWHHGYLHTNTEYKGSSYQKQLENFKRTYDLMRQKCGITMHTFGPPYNVADNTAIRMITENFPDINVFMSVTDSDKIATQMKLNNRITIESTTGIFDYDKFESSYKTAVARKYECSVILGHPALWNEASKQYFLDMIDFLKQQNCVFMTPYEYYCYKNKVTMPQKTATDFKNRVYMMLDNDFVGFETYPVADTETQKVFAPVKEFFDAFGATVRYNPENNRYTVYHNENTMQFMTGSDNLYYDGNNVKMPSAPKIINGRIMIDARFFTELMGMKNDFDEKRNIFYVYSAERADDSLQIVGSSSSYYHDYNHDGFSYDRNSGTSWKTNGNGSDKTEKSIVYDLGSTCNVSNVEIEWGGAGAGFEISVSPDNKTWNVAYSGSKKTGASFESFPLTSADRVQYVKFTSLSERNTIINEFYVRGTRVEALPPAYQPEITGAAEAFNARPGATEFAYTSDDIAENADTVLSAPYCTVDGIDVTQSVQNGELQLNSAQTLIAHYGEDAEFYADVKSLKFSKTKFYEDFDLPAVLKWGSTASWESDNPDYISVENGSAVVHHYDSDCEDVAVTLKATVSNGTKSDIRSFQVTVGLIDEFSSVVSEDTQIRTNNANNYGGSDYLRVGGQPTPDTTGSYQSLLRFNCENLKSKIAAADYIAVKIYARTSNTLNKLRVYGISDHNLWTEGEISGKQGNGPVLAKYSDNFLGEYVTLDTSKETLEIDITEFAKKQTDGIIELKLSAITPAKEVFSFYTKESAEMPPTLVGYAHDKGALYKELNRIDLGEITSIQQNIQLPTATESGLNIEWQLGVNGNGIADLQSDGLFEVFPTTDNELFTRTVLSASVTDGVNTAQKKFNMLIKNGIEENKIYFVSDNKILSLIPKDGFSAVVKTNDINPNYALYSAYYEDDTLTDIKKKSEFETENGFAIYTLPCNSAGENSTSVKAFLIDKETLQPFGKPGIILQP